MTDDDLSKMLEKRDASARCGKCGARLLSRYSDGPISPVTCERCGDTPYWMANYVHQEMDAAALDKTGG